VLWVRFPHMLFASYLTGAFGVAATGAWYLLRREFNAEALIMLRMGLYFAAVLVPVQLVFGHLNGEYVVNRQPSKMAAIEARWHDEKPASEVLLAWPDVANQRNLFAITLPAPLGSLIDSDSLSAGEVGLDSIPPQDRPPVLIPFFAFRVMVGCGLIMLAIAWAGSYFAAKDRIEQNRLMLWCIFLSFPLPHIAILTGWFTAEVGRQPWTVYGVLRTADAMTPLPDDPRGGILALFVLRGLQLHLRIRSPVHLPPAAYRTGRPSDCAADRGNPQPADVRGGTGCAHSRARGPP